MPFTEITHWSPNFSAGTAHERLGVAFHHSVISFAATIARMTDPASAVSYHCLIHPEGTRCTLVADDQIAWHAGASTFLGRQRCNDFLLGVSFAGDTYATPLTAAQVASALEWLAPRWSAYAWTIERMTDHRQISPERKNDLNPTEWLRLQEAMKSQFT